MNQGQGFVICIFLIFVFLALWWKRILTTEENLKNFNLNKKTIFENYDIILKNGIVNVYDDGINSDLGSASCSALELKDQTNTYLFADKNTLMWDSGNINGSSTETDVLGWVPKLQQTSQINLIQHATSEGQVKDKIDELNDTINLILQEFSNRELIYMFPGPIPPPPAPQTVLHYDVLYEKHNAVAAPYPPYMQFDSYYIFNPAGFRINNIDLPISSTAQIQSIQVNFYAGKHNFNSSILDPTRNFYVPAAFHLDLSKPPIFFAGYSTVQPRSISGDPYGIGRERSITNDYLQNTGGTSNIPFSSDPNIETSDLFITDQNSILEIIGTGNINFAPAWIIPSSAGGPPPILTDNAGIYNMKMTRFVINYYA